MAHKRIRPFNTSDTYPAQKRDTDLAQPVVARGTIVFLRGPVAQDRRTATRACPRHPPPCTGGC